MKNVLLILLMIAAGFSIAIWERGFDNAQVRCKISLPEVERMGLQAQPIKMRRIDCVRAGGKIVN